MERSRFDKVLDYLPIIAYFGFWLQGAFMPSFMTENPHLIALGIITVPAMAAMLIAALRIRSQHNKPNDK